ncbi:MAG: protein kinase, partial [Gemmatimonadaceae bacterium]
MTGNAKPFLPDDWAHIEPQLDQLLDAEAADRPALLERLAAGDPGLRERLAHLLAECERAMPLLDRPAVERFDQLAADETLVEPSQVLGDRYEIKRELGRGGMARVYLAEDRRYASAVAIKIVRPELAASLGRERFLREIAIVARMRHPNIMPLFDSGDANGLLYFVMPYEEGPSLRRRLESGTPVGVAEVIATLRDVAKALAYAHERGVVHRDIKPDNVMLSGGTAVVADFGIAKAVSEARGPDAGQTLTQAGVSIGTPAYMAPEQAVGDPTTNHRCDIYSFGCLAFELFAGAPPFTGESSFEVITAHLTKPPPSLHELRPALPARIGDLVARCLQKDPNARPQHASELLDALADSGIPTPEGGVIRRRSARAWAAVAAVVIAATAVAVPLVRARLVSPSGEIGASRRTLVVLPMENRTGDSGQSYLATGLADDIARRLEGIGGIRIRSGARSEWPTATRHDLELIGEQFGSTILLKTTLTRAGDSLNIDASVVDLATTAEKRIARKQFTPAGIRTAEDDLAASIAGAIFKAALPVDPHPSAKPIDPESYRVMLAGWHAFRLGRNQDSARTLFRRAIDLDPNNARAWSGLSSTWASQAITGQVPFDEGYSQGEAAANHALSLDSTQGSALANLGFLRAMRYRSLAAGMQFIDTAIARDPGNGEVFLIKSALYKNAWQWDDARKALRFAQELDPMSRSYLSNGAVNEMCAGEYEAALKLYEKGIARHPSTVEMRLGRVRALAALSRFDEAIRAWTEAARVARDTALATRLSRARGAAGYWEIKHLEGRRGLEGLKKRMSAGYVSPGQLVNA